MDSSSGTTGRKRGASITEDAEYEHLDKRLKAKTLEGVQPRRSFCAAGSLLTSADASPVVKTVSQTIDFGDTLAIYKQTLPEEKSVDEDVYSSNEGSREEDFEDRDPAQDVDGNEGHEFEDVLIAVSKDPSSTPDFRHTVEKNDEDCVSTNDAEAPMSTPEPPINKKQSADNTAHPTDATESAVDEILPAPVPNVIAPIAATSKAKKVIPQMSRLANTTRYTAPPTAPPAVDMIKQPGTALQNDPRVTNGYTNAPPHQNSSNAGRQQSAGPQTISGQHNHIQGRNFPHQRLIYGDRPQQHPAASEIVTPPLPSQLAGGSTQHALIIASPSLRAVYALAAPYTQQAPGIHNGWRVTHPPAKLSQPQMPRPKPNAPQVAGAHAQQFLHQQQ
jgi:hypothetical protein